MLKVVRRTLAVVVLISVTLLFLDFTGVSHMYLSWLAEIQFIPALLAHNFAIVLFLLIFTTLFGRLYCSVLCPLGIYQDVVAHVGRRGKKTPYTFSKAKTILRVAMILVFAFGAVVGVSMLISLLDPYAIYGRMASSFLQPLWKLGNNSLAYFAENMDSYAFYSVDVWVKSFSVLIVSLISILIISFLAWRGGRTYCNTICPVGTLLGFFSRKSFFRISMDKDKCNSCGLCVGNCKSSCIDKENKEVDGSRCVACMNCIYTCKKGAINYKYVFGKKRNVAQEQVNTSGRREFLTATLGVVTTAVSAQVLPKNVDLKVDGGLADILPKKSPERTTSLVPPGARGFKRLQNHCSACNLCVSACPNDVLKPSTKLGNFMQPTMSFENGYCRPECVKCSEVCPNNAIEKIDVLEKTSIQIGRAVWNQQRCVVVSKGDKCFNCARHCPTNAITMIDRGFPHLVPMIDTERCIGCGACENLCSSRPYSAIYVEGNNVHRNI